MKVIFGASYIVIPGSYTSRKYDDVFSILQCIIKWYIIIHRFITSMTNLTIKSLPKINLLKPCKIARSAMFHTL